jgi:hypothetical protein
MISSGELQHKPVIRRAECVLHELVAFAEIGRLQPDTVVRVISEWLE